MGERTSRKNFPQKLPTWEVFVGFTTRGFFLTITKVFFIGISTLAVLAK